MKTAIYFRIRQKIEFINDHKKVPKVGFNGFPNRLFAVKYFQRGDGGSISLDNTKGGMTTSTVDFQENQWYKERFNE